MIYIHRPRIMTIVIIHLNSSQHYKLLLTCTADSEKTVPFKIPTFWEKVIVYFSYKTGKQPQNPRSPKHGCVKELGVGGSIPVAIIMSCDTHVSTLAVHFNAVPI